MSMGKKNFFGWPQSVLAQQQTRVWDSEPVELGFRASLALQLTCCVNLDKVLNLSETHFLFMDKTNIRIDTQNMVVRD